MIAKQEHWISATGCVYKFTLRMVHDRMFSQVAEYLRELNEDIAKKRGIKRASHK